MTQTGKDDMIAITGIDDQELSVTPERPRMGHDALAGRRYDRAGTRGDGHSPFLAPHLTGPPMVTKNWARHGERQEAARLREADLRGKTRRLLEARGRETVLCRDRERLGGFAVLSGALLALGDVIIEARQEITQIFGPLGERG